MSSAVLVGPCAIRVTGAAATVDDDVVTAALASLDDGVALLGDRPATSDALWRSIFRSICGESLAGLTLACPSWWSPRRVATVNDAAQALCAGLTVRHRPEVAAAAAARESAVVVEIAPHVVVVTRVIDTRPTRPVHAEPRDNADPDAVADAVARAALSARYGDEAILVDCPDAVPGADVLGAMLAKRLRANHVAVTLLDDERLLHTIAAVLPAPIPMPAQLPRRRISVRRATAVLFSITLAAAIAAATALGHRPGEHPAAQRAPTTILAEGRVALEIPAGWVAQRITAGTGSARVQAISPSDADAAVLLTQAAVEPSETLEHTAEVLRQAVGDQPVGVFVGFNGADTVAGRPAVTYREVRPGHHIRWVVVLDGPVRIGVGCRYAPGREEAVREPCERAVASAHRVGSWTRQPHRTAVRPDTPGARSRKIPGNRTRRASVGLVMSTPAKLATDLDLMRDVAAKTDASNEQIRAMLHSFIGRMTSVPPSVWGGNAASTFKDVVDRWNTESLRLYRALHDIAETIRANERSLCEAGESHARRIGSAAPQL